MYHRRNRRPPFGLGLLAIVFIALAAVLTVSIICGQHHLENEASGVALNNCTSAMTLASTIVGSLFALVLLNPLMPFIDYLYLPAVFHPIPKPPQ